MTSGATSREARARRASCTSNLSNGTTYIYQIRAHSSAGAGPASEEASATPRESTTPTIDSVKITSAPRADDTYRAGDEIEFTMTFDQEVRVTQKNATPTFIVKRRRTFNK